MHVEITKKILDEIRRRLYERDHWLDHYKGRHVETLDKPNKYL